MKHRSDPRACQRCKRRVPRSAARCPWCLGAGVSGAKAAPPSAPAEAGAADSPAAPRPAVLAT